MLVEGWNFQAMKHNLASGLGCGLVEFGETRERGFVLIEEACDNGGGGGGHSACQIEFWINSF
jgi:hypothetical protein